MYTNYDNEIMGEFNEKIVLKIINEKFKSTFFKTKDKYCRYDFINDDKSIVIELKSRRISKNRFSSTFLNLGKYNFLRSYKKENKCKIYLFFLFTDGLYYIRLRNKIFKNFESKTIYTNDKGIEENLCIPVRLLKRLS